MYKETISEKELATFVFTSKERVEIFIKRFMNHHKVERKQVKLKLRQPGVKVTRLPKK